MRSNVKTTVRDTCLEGLKQEIALIEAGATTVQQKGLLLRLDGSWAVCRSIKEACAVLRGLL